VGLALLVPTMAACGGGGGGGGSAETFCAEFAPVNDRADEVFASAAPDPTEVEDLVDEMDELDPPDEIAEDFDLVREAFGLLIEAYGGDTGATAELEERTEEFDAADERIEPFMRDTCDLDYGDD
jgi:hypothetical protein